MTTRTPSRELDMTGMGIWLLAIAFLTSGLLLIFYLLGKRIEPSGADVSIVRDVVQFGSIVLNVAAIAVAIGAIQMAINRYQDTKETGQKIHEEIAASRKDLESLVAAAQAQKSLLENTISESKAQAQAIAEQQQKQPAAPAPPIPASPGAPLVGLLYGDSEVNSLQAPIALRRSGEFTRITFRMRNTGAANAEKGVVVVIADPSTVLIDRADGSMAERRSLHRFESMIADLRPFASSADDYTLQLDLHGVIPADFVLSVNVFGENFEAVRRKIPFHILPE